MSPTDRADDIVRSLAHQLGVEAGPVETLQETRPLEPLEHPRPRLLEGRPDNVVPLTASMVAKRLEELLKRSGELSRQAETLATALAGPAMPPVRNLEVNKTKGTTETLFSRQMNGLDELNTILDTLGRALDRAHRALS